MDATRRRRWLGATALGASVALLVVGELVLRPLLSPVAALGYYSICFLLAGTAVILALVDARAVARRSLKEQRELFDSTLKRIEADAAARRAYPKGTSSDSK